jgi:hypothetical protein
MEQTLGHFGDRRLEKGRALFWSACLRLASPAFAFALWAATGLARFGSAACFAIRG